MSEQNGELPGSPFRFLQAVIREGGRGEIYPRVASRSLFLFGLCALKLCWRPGRAGFPRVVDGRH